MKGGVDKWVYFSKIKKIKFVVIKLLIKFSFSPKLVGKIGNMTCYRFKEKIHEIRI